MAWKWFTVHQSVRTEYRTLPRSHRVSQEIRTHSQQSAVSTPSESMPVICVFASKCASPGEPAGKISATERHWVNSPFVCQELQGSEDTKEFTCMRAFWPPTHSCAAHYTFTHMGNIEITEIILIKKGNLLHFHG